ncbi:MAG: hypothetical protein WC802_03250 [Patescibacteria group bacterium]|jgi:hypothetical protein
MKRGGAVEKKFIVSFGGWYQRTTLHLSEIYDLLSAGTSKLPLDAKKLRDYQKKMWLTSVEKEPGFLEVVRATTKSGIEIRYYEDGLHVLELATNDVKKAEAELKSYFDDQFSPGLSYSFSLGAPTPKVLANLKTDHPAVVTMTTDKPASEHVPKTFGVVYQKIQADDAVVFKTDSHIVIAVTPEDENFARQLVDAQIFFREFKDQLGKYLSIHRTIWEEIDEMIERKNIGLKEARVLRAKLDRYRVTIDLIGNRMNQMGTYVNTRHSVASHAGLEPYLTTLFEYRFEVLLDTLEYIKEIWKMTRDYLQRAIDVTADVMNQGTNSTIKNLSTITTFGVLVSLVKFTYEGSGISKVTYQSFLIFLAVLAFAWAVDRIAKFIADHQKYQLKFKETEKF